jgi:signal transduction histidine kinase/DNA-binding response OmpR family regulator
MIETQIFSIFTLRLRHERHVVHARQRARDIAALLGFEHQEQIRLATAASELARNAFRYAVGGAVEFLVRDSSSQLFIISVTDSGPGIPHLSQILNGEYVSKTGLGKGIVGTKRLMDHFNISSSPSGTRVEAGKWLPPSAPQMDADRVKRLADELSRANPADPFDEIERQNQELLKTLAELREKQDLLADLNRELEDTNRGVVALYAELDQHADDLRRVSDLKTSFLSNISHEFRTPLNSILSLSRILLNRSDGELSLEQEKQVTFIHRSAAELSEMVNDLLDLAKVEAGKIDVKPRHFEVQDLFGTLRGMLKPLMAGNSLDLIFEAAPDIPPLHTDEGKISQILRNLISNALKFTRKGHVRVSAHLAADGLIEFSVADTGIGIAPENLERIFEEFVQIESDLQSQVKGTGLGLPLSRRLAQLLGGTLEADSTPNIGSVFTLKLPLCFGQPATRPAQHLANAEATGPTILFIEDNRETSLVHEISLKNSDYRLVFAANIPEARAAIKWCNPGLVVLDRLIDEQDCLFYIPELKAHGYTGPVLVVSVVDDPEGAYSAGANQFLAKPIAPFTLINTIRDLIEGASSETLLLVDDDEVTRYVLGNCLVKLGYRVLEAHNGREAIRMAEKHIPDLMVLDLIMPDLSGFEVLREIRNNPATAALRVIVHTSKDLTRQEAAELAEMKATIFPKQAFDPETSSDKLREVLEAAGIGS